jgi:hypothetical protein
VVLAVALRLLEAWMDERQLPAENGGVPVALPPPVSAPVPPPES